MGKVRKHKLKKESLAVVKGAKEGRRKKFWSIVIAVIMIGSVAGLFTFSQNSGTEQTYGTYDFFFRDNLWHIKGDLKDIPFVFLPQEVQHINADRNIIQVIKGVQAIVISYNPNTNTSEGSALAQFVLASFFNEFTDAQAFTATTVKTNFTLPVFTCANATAQLPVISLEESNRTRVTVEGNCLRVESTTAQNFVAISEKIKYLYLGVI